MAREHESMLDETSLPSPGCKLACSAPQDWAAGQAVPDQPLACCIPDKAAHKLERVSEGVPEPPDMPPRQIVMTLPADSLAAERFQTSRDRENRRVMDL